MSVNAVPQRYRPWLRTQPEQAQERLIKLYKDDKKQGVHELRQGMVRDAYIPPQRLKKIMETYRKTTGKNPNAEGVFIQHNMFIKAGLDAGLTAKEAVLVSRALVHNQPVTEKIISAEKLAKLGKEMIREAQKAETGKGILGIEDKEATQLYERTVATMLTSRLNDAMPLMLEGEDKKFIKYAGKIMTDKP